MLLKLTLVLITASVFCIAPVKSQSEGDIAGMKEALTDMQQELQAAKELINATKTKLEESDRDHTWQALHMAAAAACRGSTPSGGSGISGNVVLPKQNTSTCDEICAATRYNLCDAEVSIGGYPGKATDYTTKVGSFYNYGCSGTGNEEARFDEVQSTEDSIYDSPNDGWVWYYRYCCCRWDGIDRDADDNADANQPDFPASSYIMHANDVQRFSFSTKIVLTNNATFSYSYIGANELVLMRTT